MAKRRRPPIPRGLREFFRKLAYEDKVRKFKKLHGRGPADEQELDAVMLSVAAILWENGADEWADNDTDVDDWDGFE